MYPPRKTISNARELRKALTPPEARLWTALRRRALDGLKFRRQHPMGPFIVDFFCPSLGLVVEVDGLLHECDDNPARDERRDLWLERRGLTVLRFPASAIRDNLEGVVAMIRQWASYNSRGAAEAPYFAPDLVRNEASPGGGREPSAGG